MVDVGESHNEDPFIISEIWIININKSGDAYGKRDLIFFNPTEYDLNLDKTIDLEFDKPAISVKYEGAKLYPADENYQKYTIKLTDKVKRESDIKKTIEFEYQNFVMDNSKYKRVYQFLSKDILDLPLDTELTYQLPYIRFFGRLAYIVEYDKTKKLRFKRKEQKFTFKSGPSADNYIIFDYRPRPVLRVMGIAILTIMVAFFGMNYLSPEQTLQSVVASFSLAIIASIVANFIS